MKHQIGAVVFLIAGLVGCAAPDLQGRWEYAGPAGQGAQLEISVLNSDQIYVRGDKVLLSGVYERKGDILTLIKPDNPRAAGLKLRIVNDSQLVVSEEPAVALTGQKYISGVVSRRN